MLKNAVKRILSYKISFWYNRERALSSLPHPAIVARPRFCATRCPPSSATWTTGSSISPPSSESRGSEQLPDRFIREIHQSGGSAARRTAIDHMNPQLPSRTGNPKYKICNIWENLWTFLDIFCRIHWFPAVVSGTSRNSGKNLWTSQRKRKYLSKNSANTGQNPGNWARNSQTINKLLFDDLIWKYWCETGYIGTENNAEFSKCWVRSDAKVRKWSYVFWAVL